MIIKEPCVYTKGVFCGGAVERYERCWKCPHNPSAVYKPPEPVKASVKEPEVQRSVEETWELALKLYNEGCTDKEIGKAIGWGEKTVWEWRHENGLASKHVKTVDYKAVRKLYLNGWNDREIADELKCSTYSVANWRKSNGLKPIGKHL